MKTFSLVLLGIYLKLLKLIKLLLMTKYWIIIARREGQTLEIARRQIDTNIWDFVSTNNNESRTPGNALRLQEDDKVLFYLSKEDRDGYSLSRYQYPIFFASATLASGFIKKDDMSGEEKFVRLKDIKHFKKPIPVIKPKDNYEIGRGPTMLVEIKDYHKYEDVCTDASVGGYFWVTNKKVTI